MKPWEVAAATDPEVVRWLLIEESVEEFEAVVRRAN
jgi:hypothetical protein